MTHRRLGKHSRNPYGLLRRAHAMKPCGKLHKLRLDYRRQARRGRHVFHGQLGRGALWISPTSRYGQLSRSSEMNTHPLESSALQSDESSPANANSIPGGRTQVERRPCVPSNEANLRRTQRLMDSNRVPPIPTGMAPVEVEEARAETVPSRIALGQIMSGSSSRRRSSPACQITLAASVSRKSGACSTIRWARSCRASTVPSSVNNHLTATLASTINFNGRDPHAEARRCRSEGDPR